MSRPEKVTRASGERKTGLALAVGLAAAGGIAMLLVGGGLILSRWRTSASSAARKRRAARAVGRPAGDTGKPAA